MFYRVPKIKKLILGLFLGVFVFGSFLFTISFATAVIPVEVVGDVPVTIIEARKEMKETAEKVEEKIGEALLSSAKLSLKRSLKYFSSRIAIESATHLAKKAAGQESLLFQEGWGNYLLNVADGAAGTFLEALSETNGFAKFNLCKPDLNVQLAITLGLKEARLPDEPACTLSGLVKNWRDFIRGPNWGDMFIKPYFDPKGNDLGAALTMQTKMIEFISEKERQALLERLWEKPMMDVNDPLTEKIKTPASFGFEAWKQTMSPATQEVMTFTGDIVADSIDAFGSTFLAQYLTLVFQGLFAPGTPGSLGIYRGSGIGGRTTDSTAAYYASFIGTAQFKSPGEIDVFKLLACPEDVSLAEQSNCVVDQQFFQAIREEMTVKEAMDAGFLRGNYLFGYKNPEAGTQVEQPDLDNGYSVDNMKKLRSMRILPVGWELAAEVIKEKAKSPTTLRQVVEGFNIPGNNFYKLVDPNWVLKAPRQRCDVKAYGAATLADSNVREEICVDTKTCLREDEKGNCLAWGYCDREQNIWRFAGDECPAYYNSCETFVNSQGKSVSYLENTIDKGICNASNSGCNWYCDVADSNGVWSCTAADADLGKSSNDRLFFNKEAASCDEKEAGCSEFIRPTVNSGVNLLVNGSFEEFSGQPDDGAADRIYGWDSIGGGVLDIDTDYNHGNYSLRLGLQDTKTLLQYVGRLRAGVPYMLSGWFKGGAGTSVNLSILAGQEGEGGSFSPIGVETGHVSGTGDWQYLNISKPFILTADSDIKFMVNSSGGEVLVDSLKLESATNVTSYLDYGITNLTYVKKAPDYLDCDVNSDNPLCDKYAPFCGAEEVGCEAFTPTNGDPIVPGIITSRDLCPEVCVGYDMFIQEATPFEIQSEPAYFIPRTAQGCNQVGCEQFTNLDTEQIEYFSEMRVCAKPPTDALPVFYTWEGSDETGYQLRVWNLREETSGGAPFCVGQGSCDCRDEYGNNPDCRQFYDVDGDIHYRYYSRTVTITDDCHPYRQTQRISRDTCLSLGSNLDNSTALPIYFDENTQSCIYNGYPAESVACGAAQNGCREYKGGYSENIAIIFNDDFETGTLAGWDEGGVSPTISSESLSVGGHSLTVTGSAYLAKNVTAEVSLNKVYSLSFWAKGSGTAGVNFSNETGDVLSTFKSIELKPDWRLYNLGTAVVPGNGEGVYLTINNLQPEARYYFDNILLKEVQERLLLIKDSWVTPRECDADNNGNYLPQAQLGCESYFDRASNTYNLKSFDRLCREEAVGCKEFINTNNSRAGYNEVKNAVCWRPDSNLNADYVCRRAEDNVNVDVCTIEPGQVYCRYDIADLTDPYAGLRNSDVCSLSLTCTDLNGCACPAGDTANITCWVNKGEKSCLPKGDAATVVVPEDEFVYLVEDEKYACNSQSMGCKTIGRPSIDVNDRIAEWGATYLRDLPDTYNTTLCEPRALNCSEYRTNNKLLYFKDPSNKLCDYRVEENVGGDIRTGWFKKDTNEPCFGNYEILKNADARYSGWAGLCESQYNGCEEFVDPVATSPSHPEGKPYYYLDNEKLDRSSCNGQVSLKEGCVLFNQTGNPNVYWNAPLTYHESEKKDNKLVNPIVLDDNRYKFCSGDRFMFTDRPCFNNSDCGISACDAPPDWFKDSKFCHTGDKWDKGAPSCNNDDDCNNTPWFINLSDNEQKTVSCDNFYNYIDKKSNTNTILKVKRDRECAEWIDCTIGERIKDPTKNNQFRNVCYALGRCLDLNPDTGECIEPAPSSCDSNSDCLDGQECVSGKCGYPTLTVDLYQDRELKWSLARDYSGFAIPNMRSVDGLKEVTGVPRELYSEIRTGKKGVCSAGASAKIGAPCDNNSECGGIYENMSVSGRCDIQYFLANYNESVIEGVGIGFNDLNSSRQYFQGDIGVRQYVLNKSCRSYPASDSPFAPSTYIDPDRPTCAESPRLVNGLTLNTCDCAYQEVKAGGSTMYYPSGFQIPAYVCGKSGQACDPNVEEVGCPAGEECVKVTDNTIKLGWKGYCLEPDDKKSGRCLTWYPLDVVEGEMNLFTYNPAATYVHSGPEYYCLEELEGGFAWKYEEHPVDVTGSSLPKECGYPFGGTILTKTPRVIKDDIWLLDVENQSGKWRQKPRGLLGLYVIAQEEGPGKLVYWYKDRETIPLFKEQIEAIDIGLNSTREEGDFGELFGCRGLIHCLTDSGWDKERGYEADTEDCFGFGKPSPSVTMRLHDENAWFSEDSSDQGNLRVSAQFDNDDKLQSITVDALDNDDNGAFVILGYQIVFQAGGCRTLGRVAENGRNYAFTNNINKKGEFKDLWKITSVGGSNMADFDYLSNWQPWAGTNAYTKLIPSAKYPPLKTYVLNKTDKKCEYCGGVYEDWDIADTYLSQSGLFWLFARVFEGWRFSNDTFAYDEKNSVGEATKLTIGRPTISGIKLNGRTGDSTGFIETITINEYGVANLSFYMYDDTGRGQLPIRYLQVDWGDGNEQEITSSFGNYGDPAAFICDSTTWGRERERCVNEPLEFFHIYRARDVVDGGLCDSDAPGYEGYDADSAPDCRICEITITAQDNLAEINNATGDVLPRKAVAGPGTVVRVCKKSD